MPRIIPLESETFGRWTHKAIILPSDLTEQAANTAQTIQLVAAAIGGLVSKAATYLVTPFEDVSDAAFNDTQITVGDGNDVDRFIVAQQINKNGAEVLAKAQPATTPYAYPIADTIDITFGSMAGKSLFNLDKGELWVLLCIEKLPNL